MKTKTLQQALFATKSTQGSAYVRTRYLKVFRSFKFHKNAARPRCSTELLIKSRSRCSCSQTKFVGTNYWIRATSSYSAMKQYFLSWFRLILILLPTSQAKLATFIINRCGRNPLRWLMAGSQCNWDLGLSMRSEWTWLSSFTFCSKEQAPSTRLSFFTVRQICIKCCIWEMQRRRS